MNLIKCDLLAVIFLCMSSLVTTTYARKYLTYKGIQLILISINLILLAYCSIFWQSYILQYCNESFLLKINTNTWDNIPYTINFRINTLSFLFLFLVIIIGFATNIYILNYFKYEERAEEFILLINWFVFSMIFLVISNNFFTLIIGWELIGFTSFLLINFWKFKVTTLACSFKAYSFNKISDLFLMLGCVLLWNNYGVSDIDVLLTIISNNTINNSTITWSAICLLISACIKSAQIIGHLWLPDSMEAPVPASSLIHSATLVSAGIYLILKFQILYFIAGLESVIFFIGSITACYGGLVAAAQTDMKKLLAYSTISHCGFIMATISLDNFLITIIYLYLHGLFKASTFFCAGSIIKHNNTQDMRLMGMSVSHTFDVISLIISVVNLGGLPFTFGYLYKESFITHLSISSMWSVSFGFCLIGLLSSVIYVYKLIYYSCFDFKKGQLQTITLNIQNNATLYSKFFYSFTYSKLISFLVIYFFSIFFFLIIKYFFLKNYIFFYFIPEVITNEYKYFYNYYLLKKYIISIYYVLFVLLVLILLLNSNRANYYYHNKIEILITIWGFFNFFFITNFVVKYLSWALIIYL